MILSFDASGIPSGLAGWTLTISLVACVLYGIAGLIGEGSVRSEDQSGVLLRGHRLGLAGGCLWGGWLLQALVTLLDWWWAWNTSPRFGFAPALSATAWLVLAVYGVESRLLPLAEARRALALLAMSCLLLARVFPGDVLPHVAPLAPLHWGLGIASYGLFGVAVLHAIWLNRAERQLRQKSLALRMPGLPLLQLERLTYRFVEAGFVVLTAALVLGWWVGTVWRWDHKAVFSMLGWAVLAGLLVGRHAFGWRGLQATRWLYAGAGLLFLAYVGSRFVLEVLVHPR